MANVMSVFFKISTDFFINTFLNKIYISNLKITPIIAEIAIKTIGCHFNFLVAKNKTTAIIAPCQKNSAIFSPKKARRATPRPATAIKAVDAALRP